VKYRDLTVVFKETKMTLGVLIQFKIVAPDAQYYDLKVVDEKNLAVERIRARKVVKGFIDDFLAQLPVDKS
jgi:hypothetical protein